MASKRAFIAAWVCALAASLRSACCSQNTSTAAISVGMATLAAWASLCRRLISAAVSGALSRAGCFWTVAHARDHCRQVDQVSPRPPASVGASSRARHEEKPSAPITLASIACLVGRPRESTSGKCFRTVAMKCIHWLGTFSVPKEFSKSRRTRLAVSRWIWEIVAMSSPNKCVIVY